MTNTQELTAKISELQNKVIELETKAHIDPLKASAEQIAQNAQDEQQARENAAHLKTVIDGLKNQLAEQKASEAIALRQAQVEKGFSSLCTQADRVEAAAAKLQEEMDRLINMNADIASRHKEATGKLALDNKLSRDYRLPMVEKLGNTIIIHTEVRRYSL